MKGVYIPPQDGKYLRQRYGSTVSGQAPTAKFGGNPGKTTEFVAWKLAFLQFYPPNHAHPSHSSYSFYLYGDMDIEGSSPGLDLRIFNHCNCVKWKYIHKSKLQKAIAWHEQHPSTRHVQIAESRGRRRNLPKYLSYNKVVGLHCDRGVLIGISGWFCSCQVQAEHQAWLFDWCGNQGRCLDSWEGWWHASAMFILCLLRCQIKSSDTFYYPDPSETFRKLQ